MQPVFNFANDFKQIVTSDKTPFFFYSEKLLEANVQIFKNYFQSLFAGSDINYSFSLKTQPNFRVVQFFKEQNFHFDVSSVNELSYVLSLGIKPERISLEGVGVNNKAIDLAIEKKIGSIHFDNESSLEYFLQNRNDNLKTKITVRYQIDGNQTKIGFNRDELNKLSQLKLNGLHVYLGRESFSIDLLSQCLSEVSNIFSSYQCFHENPILFLGPGVPDLDLFKSVLKESKISTSFSVRIEAGRSLCSSAGYYAVPVLSVKESSQESKIVAVDGGLQHLGSPWVTLKKGPMSFSPLFVNASGDWIQSEECSEALIYGSLCLWHDCLHPRLKVPKDLKRGDWIIVPNMGAYGLTAGVPLFIGEKLPDEFYNDTKNTIKVTHRKFQTYLRGF